LIAEKKELVYGRHRQSRCGNVLRVRRIVPENYLLEDIPDENKIVQNEYSAVVKENSQVDDQP
jgi:hypothetical protein